MVYWSASSALQYIALCGDFLLAYNMKSFAVVALLLAVATLPSVTGHAIPQNCTARYQSALTEALNIKEECGDAAAINSNVSVTTPHALCMVLATCTSSLQNCTVRCMQYLSWPTKDVTTARLTLLSHICQRIDSSASAVVSTWQKEDISDRLYKLTTTDTQCPDNDKVISCDCLQERGNLAHLKYKFYVSVITHSIVWCKPFHDVVLIRKL